MKLGLGNSNVGTDTGGMCYNDDRGLKCQRMFGIDHIIK